MRALAAGVLLALALAGCGSPQGSPPASPVPASPVATCIITSTPSHPPQSPSPTDYGDRVLVGQGLTVTRPFNVSPSLSEVAVQMAWNSGDVQASLTSPTGRVVDRNTNAPDVLHPGSANSLTLVVMHPEAGLWTLTLVGAFVPAGGEQVGFGVYQITLSEFGPIEYVSAVPDRGVAPLTIDFDGTTTATQGATITAYRWDFGDCTAPATTAKVTHVFTAAGTFGVAVTATDSNGQTGTASRTIVVTAFNHPPTADFQWGELDPTRPKLVGFSATGQDIDGQIVDYSWNLGDGSSASGRDVFHLYLKAGTYPVKLVVTDDGGLKASTCQLVTSGVVVGPGPPVPCPG